MPNILALGFLFLVTENFVHTFPIAENKFFQNVTGKCNLEPDELFKNTAHFKECPSWSDLSRTQHLNRHSEKNVLCLLFYYSFASFCEDTKQLNLTNISLDAENMSNVTSQEICRNLFPMNKTLYHNLTEILTTKNCLQLCSEYDSTKPLDECIMAHYFAHLNVSSLAQKPLSVKSPSVDQVNNDTRNDHVAKNKSTITSSPIPSSNVTHVEKDNQIGTKIETQTNGQTEEKTSNNKSDHTSMQGANKLPTEENSVATNHNIQVIQNNSDATPSQPVSKTVPGEAKEKGDKKTNDEINVSKEEDIIREGGIPYQGEEPDELENDETDGEREPPQPQEPIEVQQQSDKDQAPKEVSNTLESAADDENTEDVDGGSYFFSYFMVICVFFVLGYVGYHNRIKVMALVLEGKRSKRQYRGRRPNSANYHKLDSNLEEAISSSVTKNTNNVIY